MSHDDVHLNLERLKRGGRKPRAGDIFVYRMKGCDFGFGRVIRTQTAALPSGNSYLIYIYKGFSKKKKQDIPSLSRDQLLIPPEIVFQDNWTLGYFEKVASRPLQPADILPVHCFYDSLALRNRYKDEFGRPLKRRRNPCGSWGVAYVGATDYSLSKALGLPIAPSAPPGPPPPLDGPGVSVYLKLGGEGFGSDEDQAQAQDLIDRLDEALERARLGVFEGDEFGGGYCAIFLRSRNVERLTELVRSVLRATPPPPGSYLLQYRPKSQGGPQRIELA